jgi:hypothetical protein
MTPVGATAQELELSMLKLTRATISMDSTLLEVEEALEASEVCEKRWRDSAESPAVDQPTHTRCADRYAAECARLSALLKLKWAGMLNR